MLTTQRAATRCNTDVKAKKRCTGPESRAWALPYAEALLLHQLFGPIRIMLGGAA